MRVRLSSCNTEKLYSVAAALKSNQYHTKPTEGHSIADETEKVGPKRSYRFVSNAEAQEMLRLYATGLSAKAVGEEVGRNPRTVTDTLRKHGVAIRGTSPMKDTDIKEMTRLYESGLSCAKIASVFGVSRGNISKHLTQAGVSLRSGSEAARLRESKRST